MQGHNVQDDKIRYGTIKVVNIQILKVNNDQYTQKFQSFSLISRQNQQFNPLVSYQSTIRMLSK